MKHIRIGFGVLGVLIGTLGFILPGSTLFLLAGLALLSADFPQARQWLRRSQRFASAGASRLDRYLLARKHR